jgi:invasion protein IalB
MGRRARLTARGRHVRETARRRQCGDSAQGAASDPRATQAAVRSAEATAAIEDEIMGIFRARAFPHARHSLAGWISLLATVVAFFGLTGPAAAQGVVKSVHGDWQVRCDTPPGAQSEQCALIQSVTAEDRPNVGLTVIVLKTADQKYRLMRVLAPLGVLLPNGLGLRINSTDIGKVLYVRCLPNGCVAEVVMDDNLLRSLRTGQTATFIIFQTPEEGIGFPMSLKGFGEGYDKLP